MLTAGVDIGSLATKAVILAAESSRDLSPAAFAEGEGEKAALIGGACLPTGPRPAETSQKALDEALAAARTQLQELAAVVATGYGRAGIEAGWQARFLDLPLTSVTEISCAARGAHLLDPAVRTVFDMGGQDSKVVRLDEDGYPADFALNDRCAAGTGRFLEVMAEALGTTVEKLDELAMSAESPVTISRTCTVFAESEVVGLLAREVEPSRIAAGLCRAVAERMVHLAQQIGVQPKVMLAGGVAKNQAIAAELAAILQMGLVVPEEPQLVVALGAAAIAAERHLAALETEAAQRGSGP